MIVNIKYQNKDKLIGMYDSGVKKIQDGNDNFIQYENETLFMDINLLDSTVKVNKKQSGIFNSEAEIKIKATNGEKESTYEVSNIPKSIVAHDSLIAINLGTEVHFINTSGWLIKKYSGKQEVKDIVLGKSVAGIVYKNRIELVNL